MYYNIHKRECKDEPYEIKITYIKSLTPLDSFPFKLAYNYSIMNFHGLILNILNKFCCHQANKVIKRAVKSKRGENLLTGVK